MAKPPPPPAEGNEELRRFHFLLQRGEQRSFNRRKRTF